MRFVLDDENSHITGHFDVMDCKSGPNRTNVMVVVRIIHLINLVVLVLKQGSATFDVLQSNDDVGFETRRRETLVLLRSGPDAFEEVNDTCRGIKRVKRQPTVLEDSDMSLNSDQDQSTGDEVKELSVVAFLVALAKDMIQRDFETSKSTGCGWIGQAILDPWQESRFDHGARSSLVDYKKRYFATLDENAHFTIETLSKIPGLEVVVPQGAMYDMVKVQTDVLTTINDDFNFMQKLLEEESVFVLPGQVTNYHVNRAIVVRRPDSGALSCAQ
ncbi:hypothetical protein PsorP6_007096 [Peronosclerospora sorghi]|uniref:Uncharacterized protein n=1 Tax=Peronosclerospora sorghi TaxID=230839 RepID=A0ACC0WC80_9STRA|nr:hypothetical protein PsorP6_007096 [Peronosclerospora sorghi]